MTRLQLTLVATAAALVANLVGATDSLAQSPDTYTLRVIVRDMVAGAQAPPAGTPVHPDFEAPPSGLVTGQALATTGVSPLSGLAMIEPSPAATNFNPATFPTWFANSDYSASFDGSFPVIHTFNEPLTMTDMGSGVYSFKDADFDPLHASGFGNYPSETRNRHFTVEGHWRFAYSALQTGMVRVCSDDSLWLFIDGQLVADLGGVRSAACRMVDVSTLGLQHGQTYWLDLFYADRAGTVSSLELTTNLSLHHPWVDSWPPAPGLGAITLEATGASGAVVLPSTLGALDDLGGSTRPVFTTCLEPFGNYVLGTHLFHCTAADEWGNQASFVSEVTVSDTQAPDLSTLANLTVEASGATTTVAWDAPAAADIADAEVAVTCAPASGSGFAVGTTTVACSAVDDAGNRGETSFSVTISDTTPPALAAPADLTVTAADAGGAIVNWPAVTASDLVDGALTAACAPASGSLFSVGVTTVTCTTADANANSRNVAFRVTVSAPAPPPPTPADADGDGVGDDADVNDHSNLDAYVSIGTCTTRVPNRLLPSGATFNDLIAAIVTAARNHGHAVSGVERLAKAWERSRLITGRDHGMIMACTAKGGKWRALAGRAPSPPPYKARSAEPHERRKARAPGGGERRRPLQ